MKCTVKAVIIWCINWMSRARFGVQRRWCVSWGTTQRKLTVTKQLFIVPPTVRPLSLQLWLSKTLPSYARRTSAPCGSARLCVLFHMESLSSSFHAVPVPEWVSAVANAAGLTSRQNDWSYVSVGVAASRCGMTAFPFIMQPGASQFYFKMFYFHVFIVLFNQGGRRPLRLRDYGNTGNLASLYQNCSKRVMTVSHCAVCIHGAVLRSVKVRCDNLLGATISVRWRMYVEDSLSIEGKLLSPDIKRLIITLLQSCPDHNLAVSWPRQII